MTIEQIHYFLTAAKHLNFTRAAMELEISQATLSRQISSMEKELNLMLFMRDNRNVSLTDSGQYLFQEFSNLYGEYRMITENARQIFAGYSGTLSFGILEESTLQGKMQDVIHRFSRKHSNYTWNLKRGSFRSLNDGLLDGTFDGIVTLFFSITETAGFRYRILTQEQSGVLISSKNPLSSYKTFIPKKFKNETFILISDTDSNYAASGAIEFCKEHGFYPKIRLAPDLDTAMLWVEAGLGLAFSYQNAVSVLNPAMTFIPLAKGDQIPGDKLVLAWNEENKNPALLTFLKDFDG